MTQVYIEDISNYDEVLAILCGYRELWSRYHEELERPYIHFYYDGNEEITDFRILQSDKEFTNCYRFANFADKYSLPCHLNINRHQVNKSKSILYMHTPYGKTRSYIGKTTNCESRWTLKDWREEYEGCDDRDYGTELGVYYKHNPEFYKDAKRGGINRTSTSVIYVDENKHKLGALEKELIRCIPDRYNMRKG